MMIRQTEPESLMMLVSHTASEPGAVLPLDVLLCETNVFHRRFKLFCYCSKQYRLRLNGLSNDHVDTEC